MKRRPVSQQCPLAEHVSCLEMYTVVLEVVILCQGWLLRLSFSSFKSSYMIMYR